MNEGSDVTLVARRSQPRPSELYQTLFLRILLFRIFNRVDTWEYIVRNLGPPVAFHFDYGACDELLATRLRAGTPIYSSAYIMPSGGRRGVPKHRVHLRLLRDMVAYGLPQRVMQTRSLEDAYSCCSVGRRWARSWRFSTPSISTTHR